MTVVLQRNVHPTRREASTHLFAIGQAVRLRGSLGTFIKNADIYRITGTLPPQGNALQYRIRNDEERYERVTTEDSLEPVSLPQAGDNATLIKRTFEHGQGAKAQQSRNQKAQADKSSAKA
jgi:hypothetical protein